MIFWLQESAESRKRELADLLTEHAQIVQEVESMSTPGDAAAPADKENTFSEGATAPEWSYNSRYDKDKIR